MTLTDDVLTWHIRRQIERDMLSVFTGNTNANVPSDGALTVEKLRQAMRDFNPPVTPSLRIVYSVYALKETTERLFPASKHRSARIRKRLIKRHGGEFRMTPAMWRLNDHIYAHPSFRSQLEASIKKETMECRPLSPRSSI
jgi:hypothetical protein